MLMVKTEVRAWQTSDAPPNTLLYLHSGLPIFLFLFFDFLLQRYASVFVRLVLNRTRILLPSSLSFVQASIFLYATILFVPLYFQHF